MIKRFFTRLLATAMVLCLLTACGTSAETSADSKTIQPSAAQSSESRWVSVQLEGGSGKASVDSPCELRPEADGTYTAVLRWSSSNYDYMMVDGEKFLPVNTEGNSVFEIPVPSASCTLAVQADTIAMSQPHLIDYTLVFGGENDGTTDTKRIGNEETALEPLTGISCTGSLELSYAKQFTADYYEGGLTLITIAGNDRFLLVPENGIVPENLPQDIAVLQQPLDGIYLVASGMMDTFAACDGVSSLKFCGLEKEDWYVDAAVDAINAGTLTYAGKYSAPDYEQLFAGGCDLAIENTMVLHSPEVVEELENLGIPVMIEHSSYEETPQGRMEWVKLAGLLTGHLDEAEKAFEEQLSAFRAVEKEENTGKTAAFFYVTTGGTVSVRNASDYIPQLISLAGGTYVFEDVGQNSDNPSTTLQMEEFYAKAKDADYLIYNSTIVGEVDDLSDFLAISPLFADMKAVKEGHVYCTRGNLYQSSMELGGIVMDLHGLFSGNEDDLIYFYRLK